MDRVKRDYAPHAIAFLREGLELGPEHDMRIARVYAALDYLETRLDQTWPVVTFRRSLEIADQTARWRNAASALADLAAAVAARKDAEPLGWPVKQLPTLAPERARVGQH